MSDWNDPPSGTFAAQAVEVFRKKLAGPTRFDAELSRITATAIEDCQTAIATILRKRYGQPPAEETGWLVEWPLSPDSQPRWWHPERGWTIDASRAIRYARKEDAEAAIASGRFVSGVFASEHFWITPTTGGADGSPQDLCPRCGGTHQGRHEGACAGPPTPSAPPPHRMQG